MIIQVKQRVQATPPEWRLMTRVADAVDPRHRASRARDVRKSMVNGGRSHFRNCWRVQTDPIACDAQEGHPSTARAGVWGEESKQRERQPREASPILKSP